MNKIVSFSEIEKISQELKNKGNIIVTTNGAFDILHYGHVMSLEKAKSFGDILIIGLNSDSSIKQYKSEDRPIIPQDYRAKMLASLEIVDYVVIFDETTPINFLSHVKTNFHVKSKSGFKGIETEIVESNGGKIELIDDIPGISTTDIIKKIIEVEKNKK
jgi:glycerol-3-phosphate cytidylyltransferase